MLKVFSFLNPVVIIFTAGLFIHMEPYSTIFTHHGNNLISGGSGGVMIWPARNPSIRLTINTPVRRTANRK